MVNFRSGILGLTFASALALGAASANAADIYRPAGGLKDGPVYVPANTWTGFYVGVNGGYGFENDNSDVNVTDHVGDFADLGSFDRTGGFGGGQIGYNLQRDRWVFGVEADIQGSGIGDDFSVIRNYSGPTRFNARSDIDFFGTVRGRLGMAWDRTLLYATGGFAYGGVRNRIDINNAGFTNRLSSDTTETGFVVGGGLEYAIAPAWSVKAEYQFIDLGDESLSNVASDGTRDFSKIDDRFSTVRVGLNYHINRGYEPLK